VEYTLDHCPVFWDHLNTVNLASRLESNAGDGQIYVSSYTYNLTRTHFEFLRHDPIKVKGKKDPVAIFEVAGALPTKSKSSGTESVPLVGRGEKFAELQKSCEALKDKKGHATLLISEAGIGKSRLLSEMRAHTSDLPCQFIEGNCRSFGQATNFYVFVDIFKQLLDIEAEDFQGLMASKVSENLPLLLGLDGGRLEPDAREAIVFIGAMLGLDLSEDFDVHVGEMDAQQFNSGTLKAVCWFFTQLAQVKPLILIIENLHVAGQSSIALLQELVKLTSSLPMILLMSMRPIQDHPSNDLLKTFAELSEEQTTQIILDPLSEEEVNALTLLILKAEEAPEDLLALIRDRAGGNPLYVEEITQNLLEDGAIERSDAKRVRVVKALDSIEMPTAIQGLILSRVDKLQPALKELLRLASVIGAVFAYELFHRLADEKELDAQLAQLSDLGMIIETKSFPAVEYSFRNVLIQEAIYSELMLAQRRELHGKVAQAIEDMYATHLQDQFELLANHYHQAENWEKAFEYTVKSGFKARDAYSSELAKRNFANALEIGARLEKPADELINIHVALSDLLEMVGDMDSAIACWRNAIDSMTEDLRIGDAKRNIGRICEKMGDPKSAADMYSEAQELLEGFQDSDELGMLYLNQSWILDKSGDHDSAIERANDESAIFEKNGNRSATAQATNNLAVFYEHKGELDSALQYNLQALQQNIEVGSKRSIGNAYLSLGYLHKERQEPDKALNAFGLAYDVMMIIGNHWGAASAMMSKARCYCDLEQWEEAEEALTGALKVHESLNLERKIIFNLMLLVDVSIKLKKVVHARTYLNSVLLGLDDDNIRDRAECARLEAEVLKVEGKKPDKKYQEAIKLLNEAGLKDAANAIQADYDDYKKTAA
jgi:tetratricopeptide (TPR) repeat protein